MAPDNADLVRSLLPPASTDIAALVRDPEAFRAAVDMLGERLDPELESVPAWQGDVPPHRGVEGLREMWLDWLEPWTIYHVDVEELIPAGDRVAVLVRDRARRADSEREVELIAGSVWRVREGRLVEVVFYGNREQLFAATGIRRTP
jgi:ketosteroid isomerase-like protein